MIPVVVPQPSPTLHDTRKEELWDVYTFTFSIISDIICGSGNHPCLEFLGMKNGVTEARETG